MKILFLIIGPVSFRAANFVRNFIKQLDTQEHAIKIMSENYTYGYLQAAKNTKFRSMTDNFDEEQFQDYLENNEFDLVIVVNLELLLFDDSNLAFKRSYFNHIQAPILFFATNSSVVFKNDSAYLPERPKKRIKINSKFSLLKACPPHVPDMEDEEDSKVETIYWKNLEQFAFLNREEAREKLKKSIKVESETKIVTLMLDIEQLFMSRSENLNYHYVVLLDSLYKYICNLNIECSIIVGNVGHITVKQDNPKVKMFFFGGLKDEDHEQLVRASDLIISESIAGTTLIDAANMKIPVITLKNTLYLEEVQEEDGSTFVDIIYNFDELTDFAQARIQDFMTNCPDALFPYYAFPNRARANFDNTKVFGHYIFTFSEFFDEKGTTSLIKDLLLNDDVKKEEIYRIEQYLALRADALEAHEILESL